MRCFIRYVCVFAFFACVFSFILPVSDASALEDVVYTTSYGDPLFYLCGQDTAITCSDYSYIMFEPTSSGSGYQSFNLLGTNLRIPVVSNSIIYIPSSVPSLFFQAGSNLSSITITLSDSFPTSDCPVCEECQVCPAIPENPYDDKFDKLIVAIYTCGAILLVIYFFYCIYRMIIKSTGGNQ